MKVALALLLCVVLVHGDAVFEPISLFYHENIGIPKAARIKAAEEAELADKRRIAGGSPAALGQYPYQAGILITLQNGYESYCGGSLLSNTRVLTAAHCWFDGKQKAREFLVVLGSTFLHFGGTRVRSRNVQVHANYNSNNLKNDIAMVRIPYVGYTRNIKNIPYATGNNDYAGTKAIVSGFGEIDDKEDDKSYYADTDYVFLSHVTLSVITNAECAKTYGTSAIFSSLICVSGANGRSTCGGDSGGPLVTFTKPRTLIGVVSFGYISECQGGYPAAFTRVTSYASWIQARL